MTVPGVVVLGVVIVAAVIDVRTRRVPNLLTFGAAGAAFVFFLVSSGVRGLSMSVAGWATGLALFLPLFLLRGLGAGDVKLLAAVGAWLGPMGALRSAFMSVMAGGVLALVVALRRRYIGEAIGNLRMMVGVWRVSGPQPVSGLTLSDAKGPRLAYATAIAAGTAAALWWSGRS